MSSTPATPDRPTAAGPRVASVPPPAPLAAGSSLGRYVVRRMLGRGGMGIVLEAEHAVLQKRVAIKVLRSDLAADPAERAAFLREGRAACRVQHPHVVAVTDAGEDDAYAYLVMELIEGESLSRHLDRVGSLGIARVTEIILPIAAALGEVHRAGIVHRDVKPENILLVPGAPGRLVPTLVDFGVSAEAPVAPQAERIYGTPEYMAPEQAAGGHVDAAADQYALAVVIFEMLTRRLPYAALDRSAPWRTASMIERAQPLRLLDVMPSAPSGLSQVLARAMERDPRARFPSTDDLGRALLPFASTRAVRRFRDLVEPGWSASFVAMAKVLASQPPAPDPRPPSVGGRVGRALERMLRRRVRR
jgi:serine/threonine-protein kinase